MFHCSLEKNSDSFFFLYFFLCFLAIIIKILLATTRDTAFYMKPFFTPIDLLGLMFERRDIRRLYGGQDRFSFVSWALQRRPFQSLVERDLSDATKDQQEGRKSLNFILSHPLLPWKLVEGKRVAALRFADGHAHRKVRATCGSRVRSYRIIQFGDA